MSPHIRRMLWAAFAFVAVFVAVGVGLTTAILQLEQRQEYRIVQEAGPILDAAHEMHDSLETMVAAARAYTLTSQTQFTDHQITLTKEGKPENANEFMLEAARLRRATPDYTKLLIERHRQEEARDLKDLDNFRQWVLVTMVLLAITLIAGAALARWRIERSLSESIERQTRRTEALIAGMADGVMVVDRDGRVVFINPAGQKLLGKADVAVPIFLHASTYNFLNEAGSPLDEKELPAAQALATGRPVKNAVVTIAGELQHVTVLMSATPLLEDGLISGVIVTFRDITERRRLEEEMKLQAERAQILADAGAFFSSNIDPIWVTQAIAERVAEVLGDWAAVILKSDEKELRVASIYHRDMSSIGLAWSYIYRQPLTVGEGIIGQVVSTGYPSLTTNIGRGGSQDMTSYHAPAMNLASLLVLPLRTRRETLGALVIAANDRARAITDANLPLAELLAERAALAIENSKLYTEQVDARRKVEDLSRLKDEFLSIASHELRTPVTSIKGYTQLAKTLIRENDLSTSEEYLDIALDQIDRMSRLILELLDVSRIETGRLEIRREPICWTDFVREIVHRHHTSVSERRFLVNLPEEDVAVSGDRDRLEQVLGNLLENAVKYSPEGSEISVKVDLRGDQVVTSVCDRGIGIPADELAQVFERFHRGRQVSSTNYGGLGLGLYITKQIIERHGGTIWVESREGAGTTFFFALPVAAVSTPAQAQAVGRA